MNKNKGFTLIELLVVVAIIGILSSVILASLNNARDKGKDASVKSQLSSMKAQAELFFSKGDELYSGVCITGKEEGGFGTDTDPGLLQAVISATAIDNGGLNVSPSTAGAWNMITCHDSEDAWAVDAPMNDSAEGSPSMFCVDSTGVSKESDEPISADAFSCQ